jgi:integrase
MAREINRLSSRAVATLAERGRYADGGGLYLQISAYGTKAWVSRYTLNGESREMGLGSLNTVSLAEAREAARECRKLIREGIDPISQRRAEKAARQLEGAKAMTFQQCAEDYVRSHGEAWRSIKHAAQWSRTLESYAFPVIGRLPVQAVDTALVMRILKPIWSTKTETATRVRGRIEVTLDAAKVLGYRSGENPARWRGHLDKLLPSPEKIRKIRHHPALPYNEMGAFMVKLRLRGAVAARGLEFLILTAARTSEVTGARWDEVDIAERIWTIAASRMKSRKEHRVPLSPDALSVLLAMSATRQNDFIFPGNRPQSPLSNMAFLQLLKRLERGDLTVHGFRSSFRDWTAERTSTPREVAEMALAHVVTDKVEAAYLRSDLFDKRRRLMDDWATFCAQIPMEKGETVVPLRGT